MIIWVDMTLSGIEVGDVIEFTVGGRPSEVVTEIRDEGELKKD